MSTSSKQYVARNERGALHLVGPAALLQSLDRPLEAVGQGLDLVRSEEQQ